MGDPEGVVSNAISARLTILAGGSAAIGNPGTKCVGAVSSLTCRFVGLNAIRYFPRFLIEFM